MVVDTAREAEGLEAGVGVGGYVAKFVVVDALDCCSGCSVDNESWAAEVDMAYENSVYYYLKQALRRKTEGLRSTGSTSRRKLPYVIRTIPPPVKPILLTTKKPLGNALWLL